MLNPPKLERSLFEEGYLVRSLGEVAHRPDVALSELVANAWDAGASKVEITIPAKVGGILSVSDDGVGMTPEQFRARWMKLGYNRIKHQGEYAEFPPERSNWTRRAYGRNGIGRHGLFCFAGRYNVETRRFDSKEARRFTVEPSSGESAFVLVADDPCTRPEHGTTLWTNTEYNVLDVEKVYDSLSFRFLHDPQFAIYVNGTAIQLERHQVVSNQTLQIDRDTKVTVLCVKVAPSKRRKVAHGVAFWESGRLVGDPTYSLHGTQLLDGRSTVANRHMIVVKSDDLKDEILPDWTGFRCSKRIDSVGNKLSRHIDTLIARLMGKQIEDNKQYAIRENKDEIRKLKPLAQIELTEFLDELVTDNPTLNPDVLTAAMKAAVNLEKSRSGRLLLDKLATISEADADRVNHLLDTWTLKDALAVLDEIDRCLSVIEAISKLMDDPNADELHSIHPLITQARWLFGPEYDSPVYASNVTIRTAAEQVFKKRIDPKGITNPRQRPDLIFLKDSTLSITGTEQFDDSSTAVSLQNVLLIELKRGNAKITLKHVQQAQTCMQDLLSCGLLDGPPFVQAFVVGHKVDPRLSIVKMGDPAQVAKIESCTFGQLVRTANKRLFRLQEVVSARYENIPGLELVNKILGEPVQKRLVDDDPKKRQRAKRVRTKRQTTTRTP